MFPQSIVRHFGITSSVAAHLKWLQLGGTGHLQTHEPTLVTHVVICRLFSRRQTIAVSLAGYTYNQ